MVKTLRFISIVCAALVAGLTVTHVLEMPGKRTLDGAEWLAVQHTFYGGFAVVGGVCEVLGLLTTGGLAFLVRRRPVAALLTAVAAISFLGMLLSYALGNRPINDLVAAWTPSTLPPNWTSYRDAWDTAHTISAGFALLALVVLLLSVLRDSAPGPSAQSRSTSAVPQRA